MAYERSTSRNIYLNVAVNTLKKLRSLVPSPGPSSSSMYRTDVFEFQVMPSIIGVGGPEPLQGRRSLDEEMLDLAVTFLSVSSLLLSEASNRKVVSHEAMLGGKLAAKTSFTLSRSNSLRAEDLTGASPSSTLPQ